MTGAMQTQHLARTAGTTGSRAAGLCIPSGFSGRAPEELGRRESPQNGEGTRQGSVCTLVRSDPVTNVSQFWRLRVPDQGVRRPPSSRFSPSQGR